MPSVHKTPTSEDRAATLLVLDPLARALGYPAGIREWGASSSLARAVGVNTSTVCRYARGIRAMSPATAALWGHKVWACVGEVKP